MDELKGIDVRVVEPHECGPCIGGVRGMASLLLNTLNVCEKHAAILAAELIFLEARRS
jgi:hypothetical protein